MTMLTSSCPRCSSPIELPDGERAEVIEAVCQGCGGEFTIGPSGAVALPRRCAAGR